MYPFDELVRIFNRAQALTRSLGMRCAAGYLRNRNITFEAAHMALLGRVPRF